MATVPRDNHIQFPILERGLIVSFPTVSGSYSLNYAMN